MSHDLKECPNQGTPYLYAKDESKKATYIIKARCKLWNCEYCGTVNAHQHWIRILNGVNELSGQGQQFYFITLTSSPKLKNTEQCLFVWRKAWRILRERLRRTHAKNCEYPMAFVITTEFHKNKRLHWHMLSNTECSTRWLKDNAPSCGLGHQCKSERLSNTAQGANYVAKYLSKSIGQADYPKKMRRIVYSQSFPSKPVPDSDFDWKILDAKESLVSAIEKAWRNDHDAYLNWARIDEIVSD